MDRIQYDWVKKERLSPKGHRLFDRGEYAPPEERYSLCDGSGARPETTDDGVLWLDFTRPLRISLEYRRVPVRDEQGFKSGSPADLAEITALIERFPAWELDLSEDLQRFLTAVGARNVKLFAQTMRANSVMADEEPTG